MGFLDRFAEKKAGDSASPSNPASHIPASGPAPVGSVQAHLNTAREKLDAKDLSAALAIYEELLRTSGDRADVLVAMSGDLGSRGYVEQIVDLLAPRYDADRHGPATGINLLQAYLATHNTTAAQHLLDILFGLNRPELEQRLHGFSNALAELIELERLGKLAPPAGGGTEDGMPPQSSIVSLVSISKPIWSYGVETISGLLPPPKKNGARRLAFAQLALLGLPPAKDRMKQPEDELARLSRGIPLWLAEIFHYTPNYAPVAALGTLNKEHYVIFESEWTQENIRQLLETNQSPIDYVFTGALREVSGEFSLSLKLWEVKRLRERKQFTATWTAATAAEEFAKFGEGVRMFMEWTPYPAGSGLNYTAQAQTAWSDSLATSLSLFLTDKGVLPKSYLEPVTESLPRLASRASTSELGSIAYLTALDRAVRLELAPSGVAEAPLFASALVDQVRSFLNF